MSFYNSENSVKIPKASELIAQKIKHDIITHKLEEGELLPPEQILMKEFGVSRPTIREAYRILESDRLVSVTRGAKGGAVIHRPAPELIVEHMLTVMGWEKVKVSELYESRTIIEPQLVRALARNKSKDSLNTLRDCLDRINVLIQHSENFALALSEFHTLLVDLAGNAMLSHSAIVIHEVVARHTAQVIAQYRRNKTEIEFFDDAKLGVKSYSKLISLLEKGDADGAESHWRKHLKKANAILLAHYDISIVELYADVN